MFKYKKLISIGTVFCLFTLLVSSCGSGGGSSLSTEPIIIQPFETFSLTSDQNLLKLMSIEPNAVTAADYGFDEGNAGLRGQFRFDTTDKKLIYERSLASGNSWNDFTIYPVDANSALNYKINQIQKVSVFIKSQVNANNGASQCGLAFGFGNSAGHANASGTSVNLRLAGRDWSLATNAAKNARDLIRFSYNFEPLAERISIDAPINSYNSATEWQAFSAAEWREAQTELNFVPSAMAALAGDYVTYNLDLVFDNAARTVAMTLRNFSSNLSLSGGDTSKTFLWDYSQATNYVDPISANARNGLDLTNVTGPTAMSFEEFQNQEFHLGFIGNQNSRICEYSQLQITLAN